MGVQQRVPEDGDGLAEDSPQWASRCPASSGPGHCPLSSPWPGAFDCQCCHCPARPAWAAQSPCRGQRYHVSRVSRLLAPAPRLGAGHLHGSCRHAAVLPPLGLWWLRDAVLLSALSCTVPVLHLLKTCVRVHVHVREDGGTGGYLQETLGAPRELALANRSEVLWAGHRGCEQPARGEPGRSLAGTGGDTADGSQAVCGSGTWAAAA